MDQMKRVTIKTTARHTLVFFNVTRIEQETNVVCLNYEKKNGGNGLAYIPWSSIETLYVSDQESEKGPKT